MRSTVNTMTQYILAAIYRPVEYLFYFGVTGFFYAENPFSV